MPAGGPIRLPLDPLIASLCPEDSAGYAPVATSRRTGPSRSDEAVGLSADSYFVERGRGATEPARRPGRYAAMERHGPLARGDPPSTSGGDRPGDHRPASGTDLRYGEPAPEARADQHGLNAYEQRFLPAIGHGPSPEDARVGRRVGPPDEPQLIPAPRRIAAREEALMIRNAAPSAPRGVVWGGGSRR
jgi:hypothetical protein